MKRRLVFLAVTLIAFGPALASAHSAERDQTTAAAVSPPHDAAAHDQAAPAPAHDHAAMQAAQAAGASSEIDVLLKKMQSAKGQARINVMADLISKLAAEHQAAKSNGATANAGMCGGPSHTSGADHDMPCPMCAAHMTAGHAK